MAKAALVARASKIFCTTSQGERVRLVGKFELKKAADMHGFITVAEAT